MWPQVQLSVDATTDSMDELAAQVAACEEERPGHPVVGKLVATIAAYREALPLMKLLTGPALRDRHWLQIFAVLELSQVTLSLVAFSLHAKPCKHALPG